MRRLSANYIFPVTSNPIKNGIVEVDDQGVISKVIDTKGKPTEISKLEFYNGILVPGFVVPYCRMEPFPNNKLITNTANNIEGNHQEMAEEQLLSFNINQFNHLEENLKDTGVKGAGVVLNQMSLLPNIVESSICIHPFIEVKNGTDQDSFTSFSRALNKVMIAWNEFKVHSSIIPVDISKEPDVTEHLINYAWNHFNPMFIQSSDKSIPADQILELLIRSLIRWSGDHENDVLNNFNNAVIIPYHRFTQVKYRKSPGLYFLISSSVEEYLNVPSYNESELSEYSDMVVISGYGLGFKPCFSMLNDIRLLQDQYPGIALEKWFCCSCLNGARAIGMEKELGSFEPGKSPGINLITNVDFDNMMLTEKSEVRVMIK